MKAEQDAIFVTGAAANGKSTSIELLRDYVWPEYFERGHMRYIEMSGIIGEAKKIDDKLGRLVTTYQSRIRDGFYLPDDATVPLFKRWFDQVVATCETSVTWIIGGAPRTIEQLCFLKMFRWSKVVRIIIDEEASKKGILKRIEKSDPHNRRVDDRPEAVHNRWEESKKTDAALDRLNGEAINLHRKDPLVPRVKQLLASLKQDSKCPIRRQAKTALESIVLKGAHHPLYMAVAMIEG